MKKIALTSFILFSLACLGMAQEAAIGEALSLFNGEDLTGWETLKTPHEWQVAGEVTPSEDDPTKFTIKEGNGVLVNGPEGKTSNILTEYEHGDCQLHIEFMVPKGSNSGVYFQGLYEIQVFDSYQKEEVKFSDCGGIYARYKDGKTYEGHPPRVNASKAPGEWQSFDAVFQAPRFDEDGNKTENARFVIIKHNGVVVHEDVELTGNTRASLNKPEAPRGPLMLQGDHGPVAYRNIILIPLN